MALKDFTDRLKPAYDGAAILAAERARSSIHAPDLSDYLLGHDFLQRQSRIAQLLESEKLFSKTNQLNLSRPDRYALGLARAKKLRRMSDEYKWNDADYDMAFYLVDEMSPYALNTSMFKVTLLEQLSDQQKSHWLPLWENWKVIGAYAQTELGHGSNVRGLELEARWTPRGFILHSPTLTSSKFWNGALGRTATHAVVVAQLYLPDKAAGSGRSVNYGPHTFIVQIRDEKHQPLSGIAVGDIGPKYGYASMDNGYMLFDQHLIPHSALCARYSSVDPKTGAYHKPPNSKVVYGSLTATRKDIIMQARLVLARAVTIAVRYTSIRRQFKTPDSSADHETAVLDYPSVQIRVLPLLATTYALHFGGLRMAKEYEEVRKDVERGNFDTLNDMHSLSSGLKSLCTTLAADGIETCRRAMGGHGFSGASGLVGINSNYLSKPTVEGDNWMITQQLARNLIKIARRIVNEPFSSAGNRTEANLQDFWRRKGSGRQTFDILNDDHSLVAAFEGRAAFMTFAAYDALEVRKRPWNSQLVQLYRLSNAHSEAVLVRSFHEGLSLETVLAASTKAVLWMQYRLYALYTLDRNGREFSNAGAVSDAQLDQVLDHILELMERIRPHAVTLVDARAIPEYLLDSALGRTDGRVYEDLFHRAHRLNPLNKVTFNPDYRTDELVLGANDGGEILSKL